MFNRYALRRQVKLKFLIDPQNLPRNEFFLKVVASFGAIIVAVFGFYQYKVNLEKEYKKPFWEAQFKVCNEASLISSKIALESESEIRQETIDELFTMYYGQANFVLDAKAFDALGDIGSYAVRCKKGILKLNECIRPIFNGKSFGVAQACRNLITVSWNMPLEQLSQNQIEPNK